MTDEKFIQDNKFKSIKPKVLLSQQNTRCDSLYNE